MDGIVTMAHDQFAVGFQALAWRAHLARGHHELTYVDFISK